MPYNGSGSFTPPGADFPAVASTLIESTKFNNVINDIATGLSTAITKDGQTTVTNNIPLNGNKLTGVGAATARTDAATLASIQDGTGVYVGTVGGTADVITLTSSPAITAYAAGQTFRFIASGANTTNVTVNVSGLGAKAITKNGTTALVAGDITSGAMVQISYDGTRFILGAVNAAPIPMSIIDAAGDGIIGTAADTAVVAPLIYAKIIHGLTYDNGTDATNDININTGGAMDATGARWMRLATALGKQSDVAWAVGGTTGAPLGWLDTGAVGNSDYYIWLIMRSDTGVVDSLCSLSSTAPTMPANYDFKRLVGWFKRVGGTIVAFKTYETEGGGLDMAWTTPTLDVDSVALTTSRLLSAVKVPLNFSTIADLRLQVTDAGGGNVVIQCPDETDAAPSSTATPLLEFALAAGSVIAQRIRVRTSATGTIAARASAAMDTYRVLTVGFTWARRN